MIFTNKFMYPLFHFLERTKGISQKVIHHPEGDVFTHSLQVLHYAFRESNDTDLILAAMLHDIGKYENSLGHEKIAVEWLEDCVSLKTLWLIENHMRVWHLILGEMKKLSRVKELSNHPWIPELVLLARWDKLGRNPGMRIEYSRKEIINRLNKCVDNHFKDNVEKIRRINDSK